MQADKGARLHRRSIRLPEYDYSHAGAYFVTVCTAERNCLFGKIEEGTLLLNAYGNLVHEAILNTESVRKNVLVDYFIVMPNHFHAIFLISDEPDCRGVLPYAPSSLEEAPQRGLNSPSQTIGAIVRGLKGATTTKINELRGTPRYPVWQRNYYEHIIRNEKELSQIRDYIYNNPLQWEIDDDNPDFIAR